MVYSGSISHIRRSRTYSRRALATISGDLKRPCFFMHIPKCGGTSLSEALNALVPLHRRIGLVDANSTRRAIGILEADTDSNLIRHDDLISGDTVHKLREQMLLTHMAWSTPMIYGHIPFSQKAWKHFGDKYAFVTMLREPIARTISSFGHSSYNGLISQDFDAYLKGPVLRTHGLSFLRYFSGRHWIDKSEEAEVLEIAKSNMDKFSVIGFLNDVPSFEKKFKSVIGRAPHLYHYNEKRSPPPQLTQMQRETLSEVLSTEMALWDYAREKWA